jgi:hypothetical protein
MGTVIGRRSVASAVVGVLVVLAGCGGGSPAAATVVGVAGPCTGPISNAGYDRIPLSVNLVRGHTIVSTRAFEGRRTFSFRTQPGVYRLVLVQEGLPPNASPIPPVHVVLRSGQVSHVSLLPSCK